MNICLCVIWEHKHLTVMLTIFCCLSYVLVLCRPKLQFERHILFYFLIHLDFFQIQEEFIFHNGRSKRTMEPYPTGIHSCLSCLFVLPSYGLRWVKWYPAYLSYLHMVPGELSGTLPICLTFIWSQVS